MIETQCTCGRKIRTKDENAGKRVKCPDCKSPICLPQVDDGFLAGLDNAISMERKSGGVDLDIESDLISRLGKKLAATPFDCPQCSHSLLRSATDCPKCHLSFRKGHCAVCGERKASSGKQKCRCQARVVVWVKETRKGFCTNCGRLLPKMKGLASKLKGKLSHCCPRCSIDDLLERKDSGEIKLNNSYELFLASSPEFGKEKSRKSDRKRMELIRKMASDIDETIQQAVRDNKPSFLKSALTATVLGALVGSPEAGVAAAATLASRQQTGQLSNEQKLERIDFLLLFFNQVTDHKHATWLENCSRNIPKLLAILFLGFFSLLIALFLIFYFLNRV